MKWGQFFKTQFYIAIANSIPFLGIAILDLITQDRIINSYESFHKNEYFLPKWTFSIFRSIALTFISFSSYRVWFIEKSKKNKQKSILAYIFYAILLCFEWSTIFLSPTNLDLASFYYCALIIFAFTTALIFKQVDKIAGIFYFPYIIWLIYMTIVLYILHIYNRNNEWFLNYDGNVYNLNTTLLDKYFMSNNSGSFPTTTITNFNTSDE
ncbi:hypothetical protein PVAND_008208 [Polypedilum vanderplanki]|uniref:TspO/MBR family protein n=1 Tax=Polypedilum vanderplanki TaxID=319348 RepID=A0A9J6C9E4_POLVA|nr:hypothetical protein PVAND_008208 [Polypedilum vanderplanki]